MPLPGDSTPHDFFPRLQPGEGNIEFKAPYLTAPVKGLGRRRKHSSPQSNSIITYDGVKSI